VNAVSRTHTLFEIVPGLPRHDGGADVRRAAARFVAHRGRRPRRRGLGALAAAPGPLILHATATHLPDAPATLIEYG